MDNMVRKITRKPVYKSQPTTPKLVRQAKTILGSPRGQHMSYGDIAVEVYGSPAAAGRIAEIKAGKYDYLLELA